MPESGGALINFGELSKPATILIERISDAVGGIAKPWQTRRVARAEADAEVIRAQSKIQISEIERRALERLVREEGRKQENIEDITAKAIHNLNVDAVPENIGNDWLAHFFERCRLTSNDQMQSLWGKILAGEANVPSSFSKKTVEVVSLLDAEDARLFTELCTFCWTIAEFNPLVFDYRNPIYGRLDFDSLAHLEAMGLANFGALGFSQRVRSTERAFYFGTPIDVSFPDHVKDMNSGTVILTRAGIELARVCGAERSDDFLMFVLKQWQQAGCVVSSPLP